MSGPQPLPDRIDTIDGVRGFAVLGILIMNIVAFAMPADAYNNPLIYGGSHGADLAAWVAAFAIADGKMRGLFTLLFGASLLLVAESAAARGGNPVSVHYRRMAWLLVIGMLHGYFIWYGDILVEYAITGAIVFVAWRWQPAALFYAAFVLFVADLAVALDSWCSLVALRDHALAPHASAGIRHIWQSMAGPGADAIATTLASYRGDWSQVFAARLRDLADLERGLPVYLIESTGTALFGMALYRTGYFTRLADRAHRLIIIAGYGLALPVAGAAALQIAAHGFDPVSRALGGAVAEVARPLIMLAHASLIILLIRSGRLRWLADRLVATGRMALSNYLATSVVMTMLFYGTGLGLFGTLSRWQLYPFVLAMWVAIMLWSKPWLHRYRYGPVEWLWRSLARWHRQPFARSIQTRPPQ